MAERAVGLSPSEAWGKQPAGFRWRPRHRDELERFEFARHTVALFHNFPELGILTLINDSGLAQLLCDLHRRKD